MVEASYFTTTLSQAAARNARTGKTPHATIPALLDAQAKENPLRAAVGFVDPGNGHCHGPRHVLLNFRQLRHASIRAAQALQHYNSSETVALLAPSTPEFLFAWLGLLRLGVAVLLIAPQCQPEAVAHLCRSCNVERLLYDDAYRSEAEASRESMQNSSLHVEKIPFSMDDLDINSSQETGENVPAQRNQTAESVAYLFHTSGTSSGLPKPIPQTNNGAIRVLPHVAESSDKASFTTTPLYHGGISDCLRAWTSDALIWLFWARNRPITAKNVRKCLEYAETAEPDVPAIKYFASVPYILQMMASDAQGLKQLQSMDMVGVGGAALPGETGDELVRQNVNLVSRYGSAECGFLLSSHREYSSDKDWQWLRLDSECKSLSFEQQGDQYELVVLSSWPHRAKSNRPDGSFATSDLLEAHPTIPGAWRYHSRADSQLTLITGKKFDPSPLEDSLTAQSSLLSDAVIFGDGMPFPGALLFRSEEGAAMLEDEILKAVGQHVEELNAKSQDHARIGRNMLIVMDSDRERPLRSSKGTLLRNKAYELYRDDVDRAYTSLGGDVPADGETMSKFLQRKIGAVVQRENPPAMNADLFAYGVDSVASIQIRHVVKGLVGKEAGEPSMTVVEDAGTIERLCEYIQSVRDGKFDPDREQHDLKLMQDLVEKYGDFTGKTVDVAEERADEKQVVLLTGSTGALGAHLLSSYRSDAKIGKVYCLVRGASHKAATDRVDKSLLSRGLAGLEKDESSKIVVLQARLSEPDFGLEAETLATLKRELTLMMHVAWAVNFRLSLQSFEGDHIAGTEHLLSLALSCNQCRHVAFCSSVASVARYPLKTDQQIPESVSTEAVHSSTLGYGRSKWVAEQLCARAAAVAGRDKTVSILRIGQLSGDMEQGIWNRSEAWPLMLGSSQVTGCLPDLDNTVLDWLPVDVAARAIAEAAVNPAASQEKGAKVLHIVNSADKATDWREMLDWIKSSNSIETVEPKQWIERMGQLDSKHPASALLPLWRDTYGRDGEIKRGVDGRDFVTDEARKAAPELAGVRKVEREYFDKLWAWIERNVA